MCFKLLSIGSPLVDYSLAVTEKFLDAHVPRGKGGTRNISAAQKEFLICAASGVQLIRTPGGSAANTIRAFAALGGKGTHFGKIGNDDDGMFFRNALLRAGADDSLLIISDETPTGFCLTLVTPDAERTMLSNLGASLEISDEDLEKIDFSSFDYLLIEGYLACESWIRKLIKYAKDAGCKIALDLNNFELVARQNSNFRDIIPEIDLLFANEQEAVALFPDIPGEMLPEKLQKVLPLSVLKMGKNGSLIIEKKQITAVNAVQNIEVLDTTGAGDFYAAGFFYGLSKALPLYECGKLGSLCAAEVIQLTGTMYRDEDFEKLNNLINKEVLP